MRRWAVVLLGVVWAAGCAGDDGAQGDKERVGTARSRVVAPLDEAFCVAEVDGVGPLEAEAVYLPQVIACENSGAAHEALKAQAVAARSVLYWNMGTHGSICDSQACQVYSCNNPVLPEHEDAVLATSGQYLAYNNNVTYGFYVNGDPDTGPPSCMGDPQATNEPFITYNEGLTGTDVIQTTLGFVFDPADAEYGQNRGCMSQWGARCLEDGGRVLIDILRFYYGDDIALLQATGPCVTPPQGSGGAGGTSVGSATSVSAAGVGGGSSTSTGDAATGAGGGPAAQDSTAAPSEGCDCRAAPGSYVPAAGSPGAPKAPGTPHLMALAVAAWALRPRATSPR